jgi:hypothetical protein
MREGAVQVPNLMGSEPPPPLFFDATASLVICRPSIKFVLKNSYLKQRGEAPSAGAVSSCTAALTSLRAPRLARKQRKRDRQRWGQRQGP